MDYLKIKLKVLVIFLFFITLFFSSPVSANPYPFKYEEVIIENPTCPFYFFEIDGEKLRQPCPYGTMKAGDKEGYIQIDRAAAGLCRYTTCSKDGFCGEKTKFMGADSVTEEYTGPGEDADKRCILAYTEDSKINTYCNLIAGKSTKEFCFSFAPPNLNIYWILYFLKIIAPLIVGSLLVFWYRHSPRRALLWAVSSITLCLAGVLSNNGFTMDNSSGFVYCMLVPPALSVIAFFWSRKWFNSIVFISNIIAIIFLFLMIMSPAT